MAKHTSTHLVGKRKIKVPRNFKQAHLDAGYHEQVFGEHSHSEHGLLGEHATGQGTFLVEHLDEDLPEGAGGPVFKISFPDGAAVTVLCADTVQMYLDAAGPPR